MTQQKYRRGGQRADYRYPGLPPVRLHQQRDGYLENNGTGDDMNDVDDWNVIGKLLYVPTDDLSISFKGTYVDRNPNCCAADACWRFRE